MSDSEKMVAELLSASTSAYAACAANRLFEKLPEAEIRFGNSAFDDWQQHFLQRIHELAAAIAEGEPALFESQVRWTRSAFVARQVPENLLRESLICLGEVLAEELPNAFCQVPAPYISASLKTLEEKQAETTQLESKDKTSRLAMQYLLKILEGDCRSAIKMILDERQLGMSLEESYQTLILSQCDVGKMWHQAEVSVAEEHLVTSTTERAMAILAHLAEKQDSNGWTLVSAAVQDNAHDIGIRVVSDFFEFAGWRVVCLGGNLPATEVVGAVNCFDASLVLLSATMSTHLKAIRQTIEEVRTASEICKIMVGGSAFSEAPDIWRRLGADAYAATPAEAVTIASQLMEESCRDNSVN